MTNKKVLSELESNGKDSLIACLIAVAKTMGMTVEESKIQNGWATISSAMEKKTIIRFVRDELKLRARIVSLKPGEILGQPIPAIARLTDNKYVVLGKHNHKRILIFDPSAGNTKFISTEEFLRNWSGQLIFLSYPFNITGLIRKFNLNWFLPAISKYKRYFVEVFIVSFFLQLFGLVTPLFMQVIIDKVIIHRGVSTLDILVVVLLTAGIFQTGMSILRTYLLTHTTNKLDVILGARLFRHISALPLKYFEHRRVGDTIMRVAAMNSIRDFLTGSAITAITDSFFAVVFFAVMFYYSVPLTLVAMVVLPIYLVQNILATPIYRNRLNAVWTAGSASNAFLIEAVTGIHTVKALALEPQFNHKWEQMLEKYVRTSSNSSTFNIVNDNTGKLIQLLSGLSILWFGGHMVMEGKLTVGQLIAFQMLAGQASAPLFRLVGMWQAFQQTTLSLEQVGDILLTPPESMQVRLVQQPQVRGKIQFEQVSFRYSVEGPEVLDEFSFVIPPGAKVGIVGRSGSGKSTLTKLVQRMYLPEKGRILIDGHDLAQVDPTWLRRQIGVVLQESYLFNGSVRDNIAIARPSAPIEEIISVSQTAAAHEFILEMPEGYDTQVGERGTTLSGGQRQRIAIARALLSNPRILIFDEATSALDYQSEQLIRHNLNIMSKGRTLLMIAHRLSTVRQCDVIIVVDRGRVVEQGNHYELLAYKGIYYQLYKMQYEV